MPFIHRIVTGADVLDFSPAFSPSNRVKAVLDTFERIANGPRLNETDDWDQITDGINEMRRVMDPQAAPTILMAPVIVLVERDKKVTAIKAARRLAQYAPWPSEFSGLRQAKNLIDSVSYDDRTATDRHMLLLEATVAIEVPSELPMERDLWVASRAWPIIHDMVGGTHGFGESGGYTVLPMPRHLWGLDRMNPATWPTDLRALPVPARTFLYNVDTLNDDLTDDDLIND